MAIVTELTPLGEVECALTRMHLTNGGHQTIVTFILDQEQLTKALAIPGSDALRIENLRQSLPPDEFGKIKGQIFNVLEMGILDQLLPWSAEQCIPVHFYEIIW